MKFALVLFTLILGFTATSESNSRRTSLVCRQLKGTAVLSVVTVPNNVGIALTIVEKYRTGGSEQPERVWTVKINEFADETIYSSNEPGRRFALSVSHTLNRRIMARLGKVLTSPESGDFSCGAPRGPF